MNKKREYSVQELSEISDILSKGNHHISVDEIKDKIGFFNIRETLLPELQQAAFLVRLLKEYEEGSGEASIIIEETGESTGTKSMVLGALGKDWAGMSNSIIGIVHHRACNIEYMKGLTLDFKGDYLGVVVLVLTLDRHKEYEEFLVKKMELVEAIRFAATGSDSKFHLLEDETVKFEIYNRVTDIIKKRYSEAGIEEIIGDDGEALKFISARSREYLEERYDNDLVELILDNYVFQKLVKEGSETEVIKIKNFETKYERLTGITFASKEILISIEDFLKTLEYIVPGHMIKHHKSLVTSDGVFIYRLEIVDRNGIPLKQSVIKSIERSIRKMIHSACKTRFARIKSIGGFEHYARAIIPFLMMEMKKTDMTQVFFKVDRKTDFFIELKIVVVSRSEGDCPLYRLMYKLESIEGIEIISTIPPKLYSGTTRIDILKVSVSLAEFYAIKDIFGVLKGVLKDIYGDIRDFDQGFREIDIRVMNDLLDRTSGSADPELVRDIYFNFDELYRIEIPLEMIYQIICICTGMINKFETESESEAVDYEIRNVDSARRTVIVMSYYGAQPVAGRIVQELKDYSINFTRFRWEHRSYAIVILHKDNKPLEQSVIDDISKRIEEFK